MNGPMTWNDTAKAAARAILAERKATAGEIPFATTGNLNPHNFWLSRIKQPREQATPTQQGSLHI
jgi:hypothetical protein